MGRMQLTSSAFGDGEPIPRRHTGEGEDCSPGLEWTDPPPGTRCFALVCEDPDAPCGVWVHWVICGIPSVATGLAEGVPIAERLPDGSVQGRNGFGRIGYGGPMPPPGQTHRYCFRLWALDCFPAIRPGATAEELREACAGHVLGEGRLTGTYERVRKLVPRCPGGECT